MKSKDMDKINLLKIAITYLFPKFKYEMLLSLHYKNIIRKLEIKK